MSRKRKILIAAVILLLLIGFYFVFIRGSKPQDNGGGQNSNEISENTQPAVTITYTDSGFQPGTATMKPGQLAKFVNNSSKDLKLESDPHPDHTDETALNLVYIARGDSRSAVLTQEGTWSFHNDLNEADTGEITISNAPVDSGAAQ